MKHLLSKAGRTDIEVESAALHTDEIGSDIHRGTRKKLLEMGIPFTRRSAWLLTPDKASEYDLLIGMDWYNISDLRRLVRPADRAKIHSLLEYAGESGDIADPWYTGNFDATYNDVVKGCSALLAALTENNG